MSGLAYEFTIDGMAPDTFAVLEFTGKERLSEPYQFVFQLVSEKKSIDFEAAISATCKFKINQNNLFTARAASVASQRDAVYLHGIVISLDVVRRIKRKNAPALSFYRVVMSNAMYWMGLDNCNQVYCGKSIPEIVEAEFKSAGLKPGDDFKLEVGNYRGNKADDRDAKDFPRASYITQYRESSLNFIDRLLQREGIYYFYTHSESANTVHLVDSKDTHPNADPQQLKFDPEAPFDRGACVQEFHLEFSRVVKKIRLRDYNPKRPDSFVDAEHSVHDKGVGQTYLYGENFSNENDANNMARLRAELFLCRRKTVSGTSTASFLRPGHKFDLSGHFIDAANASYLLTSISHHGSQAQLIDNLFGYRPENMVDLDYSNTFSALPADVQFRPELTAQKPRIYSTVPAHIDHDEINDIGAYKVKMPFDLSNKDEGKASCWCRFMKQYVGTNFGQHYPLRKGTEVMMAFCEGDPDQPYIIGAMENATHSSVTNSKDVGKERLANGNFHMFSTKGVGNLIGSIPEGTLAGYATAQAQPVSVSGNSVTISPLPSASFAGMAGQGSSGNSQHGATVTLGQQNPTKGLMPGSITPTVITGQTQPQTNVISADEQTMRTGARHDEHSGTHHEAQVGDRYVSHSGSTHMEQAVHNTRIVKHDAETTIQSTSGVHTRVVSAAGSVKPGSSSGGGSATSAGFAAPSITEVKKEYLWRLSNAPEQIRQRHRLMQPLFANLSKEQMQTLTQELHALHDQAGALGLEQQRQGLSDIIGRYFAPDDAKRVLAFFSLEAQTLQAGSTAPLAGFANESLIDSHASEMTPLDLCPAEFTPVVNAASCDLTVAAVYVDLFIGEFYGYFILCPVGVIWDINTALAYLNTDVGATKVEGKFLGISTQAKTEAAKTKMETVAAAIEVLAGGGSARLSGAPEVAVALEEFNTKLSETYVAANSDKMMALHNTLEATSSSIRALNNSVEATQSAVTAIKNDVNVTMSHTTAAKIDTAASKVSTNASEVVSGAAQISAMATVIVT